MKVFHCQLLFYALVEMRFYIGLRKFLDRVRSGFCEFNRFDAIGFSRGDNALQRFELPLYSVNSVY